MATRRRSLCCLLLLSCSAAPVRQDCSDATYLATAAKCAAAVSECRFRGGLEQECATICDDVADAWAERCGQ